MSPELLLFISCIIFVIGAGLILDYFEKRAGSKKSDDLLKYKTWERRIK